MSFQLSTFIDATEENICTYQHVFESLLNAYADISDVCGTEDPKINAWLNQIRMPRPKIPEYDGPTLQKHIRKVHRLSRIAGTFKEPKSMWAIVSVCVAASMNMISQCMFRRPIREISQDDISDIELNTSQRDLVLKFKAILEKMLLDWLPVEYEANLPAHVELLASVLLRLPGQLEEETNRFKQKYDALVEKGIRYINEKPNFLMYLFGGYSVSIKFQSTSNFIRIRHINTVLAYVYRSIARSPIEGYRGERPSGSGSGIKQIRIYIEAAIDCIKN